MAGIKKTLGGDRIGSEEKMKLWLHDYESSTHDISRIWRSSMAPGVLYPFMAQLVEDGDVCEIDLRALARTIPTVGPLFGSFKLQLELYHAPFRLYNGLLHNNAVKIGLNMAQVKFPKLNVATPKTGTEDANSNDWIEKSSLLHYMKICDVPNTTNGVKKYNAVKFLGYYDIIKNYHINKQEPFAYIIGGTQDMGTGGAIVGVPPQQIKNTLLDGSSGGEPLYAGTIKPYFSQYQANTFNTSYKFADESTVYKLKEGLLILSSNEGGNVAQLSIRIDHPKENLALTEAVQLIMNQIRFSLTQSIPGGIPGNPNIGGADGIRTGVFYLSQLMMKGSSPKLEVSSDKSYATYTINLDTYAGLEFNETNELESGGIKIQEMIIPTGWNMLFSSENPPISTGIASFPIENFDKARWTILKNCGLGDEVRITGINTTGNNVINYLPYSAIACNDTPTAQDLQRNKIPMNGLALKCYLSDIFNNWLDTEVIDGDNGINAITSIAVTDGEFTIDALNLANRVYNVLNRIAISGGTYEDWREAVFGKKVERRCESPMYIGGASGEITFEEVVSTGAAENDPLGTLAGKGTLSGPLKGGYIRHYCEEAGYIIGIISLTPRIDYSQGVEWDNELDNFDQLHKPGLDCIGFQNLMASWMHGRINNNVAIGKQPAWIQYQTAVNEAHGDFADENKAMYMTLNRRFEVENIGGVQTIQDATTYIDPAKFNYAFADAAIDSQNFWIQIGIDFRIRRLMSANQIPNL